MTGPIPKEKEMHRIAVTGIIWKEEDGVRKYLITQRAAHKKAWPLKWTVPGGGMEVDDYIHTEPTYANSESPQWYGAIETTVRREIKEEVGLEVEKPEYLLDVVFIRPDGVPCVVLSMFCKYKSGDIAYDEDTADHAWITAEEVGKYELIQGIDHEIEQVEAILAKR